MKLRFLSLLAGIMAFLSVNAQQVILYADCNFRGQAVALQPGNYLSNQHGMRLKDLSSLQIPAGMAVNLFAADFFGGQYITLYQSSSCLINQNFNDEMVSLQVYRTNGSFLQQNQAPVTIFERCNYGGQSSSLFEGTSNQISMGFIKSQAIRVAPGYAVIFQKETRQGMNVVVTNEEYRADKSCLPILWGANVKAAYVYRLGSVYDNYWNTNQNAINTFNQGAIVYEHSNYGGRAQILNPGAYRGYQLDQVGGERVISSLKVFPGYRIIAFSGSNFDGSSITFTSNNTNLSVGPINWNDRISSMIVERTTGGGGGTVIVNPTPTYPNGGIGIQPGNLPQNAVTIFSEPNLNGGKWSAPIGSYRSNQILFIGPATTQSIYVPVGYRMVAYTGSSFNGSSRVFGAGTYYNLASEAPGWNRAINSFVVERDNGFVNPQPYPGSVNTGTSNVVMFTQPGYGGSSAAFQLGSHNAQQMGGNFAGNISSLQIPAGYRVVAWDGPNFTGTYRVFTYSIDNLGAEGNGQWNKRIRSLRVEMNQGEVIVNNMDNVPGRPQPVMNVNDFPMAYADAFYQGSTQSLPPGSYNANQLPGTPPRTISSFRIPPGYKVTVFDGPNFNGDFRVLTYSIDNFVAEGGGRWNDRISSIIVERAN
jgi:hypothetical protein